MFIRPAAAVVLAVLVILFSVSPAFSLVRNIQDNHQLVYNVLDVSGNHVAGQTVTLQIKKVSTGAWFDFSDSTFKTSGWISKTTNLSEDATNGFYFYTFNPPASETSAEQYQFVVDNADATYGDHQSEVVDYQDLASQTVVNRIDLATNGVKDSGEYNGIEKMIRQHGN